MPVRSGPGGHRLGHESNLDQRPDAGIAVGVKDAIDDRPVIDGLAVSVFGIRIGRSPFERAFAVSAGEQVVGADVDGDRAQRGEFVEQLLSVGAVGEVRLVVAEVAPGARQGSIRSCCIDGYFNRGRSLLSVRRGENRRPPGGQTTQQETFSHEADYRAKRGSFSGRCCCT